MTHGLPTLVDDGLTTEEIGAWGEDKYRLLGMYAQLFSKSMERKWCRVYIDLFAGSGRARIEGTQRIITGSPLVALGVEPAFDNFIFCEKDPKKLAALKARVAKDWPIAKVAFQQGDANEQVGDILQMIPQHRKDFKVLSFCFVDPYNLKDLAFETIDRLSSRFVDFLVLIATGMDADRNVSRYEQNQNSVVEKFLGVSNWRQEWRPAKESGQSFSSYLMRRFSAQMETRGYILPPIEETKLVRSTEKNLPLYRLALFSRHDLGKSFWEQALKYSDDQRGFEF